MKYLTFLPAVIALHVAISFIKVALMFDVPFIVEYYIFLPVEYYIFLLFLVNFTGQTVLGIRTVI